jgi:transcriptional regulator with XRE-family HTH domain
MVNLNLQIGERIKYLRKNRGYTQAQLGEKVQLPQNYIGGIEKGEKNLTLETLERIINVLEISPEELFFPVKNKETLNKDRVIDSIAINLRERELREIELIHKLITDMMKTLDHWSK